MVCRPHPSKPAPSRPRPSLSPHPADSAPQLAPSTMPCSSLCPPTPQQAQAWDTWLPLVTLFGLGTLETFPGSWRCLTSTCLWRMRPFPDLVGWPGVQHCLEEGCPAFLAVTSSTVPRQVGSGASWSRMSHANGVLEASPAAWGWASVRAGSRDLDA